MGRYGIRENKNIVAGNMARKKLNANACARVTILPFCIPVKKKSAT
jgi:hypothetical protein